MITREQALTLRLYTTIHQVDSYNANGSPTRWRINGMCKTWKTRPLDFRLPIKHGLTTCDYLTQWNQASFYLPKGGKK